VILRGTVMLGLGWRRGVMAEKEECGLLLSSGWRRGLWEPWSVLAFLVGVVLKPPGALA